MHHGLRSLSLDTARGGRRQSHVKPTLAGRATSSEALPAEGDNTEGAPSLQLRANGLPDPRAGL